MRKLKHLFKLIKRMLLSSTSYAKSIGVIVGKDCIFYNVKWSTEPYLITVGNNCQITNGVRIFTHGGSFVMRKEYPDFDCFGKVKIKDNVYIGNNSLIMPGVTIGENVLVAAGSVVTKSVPDNVCVGGNPARIICSIEEFKKKNINYNLNSRKLNSKQKQEYLLSIEDDRFIKKSFLKNN